MHPDPKRAVAIAISIIALSACWVLPTTAAPILGEGWLAGPGAVGDNTYSGVIDTPTGGASIATPGAVQLAGWFVDRSADGWAGADDVEIYLGTMGNGGALLTHAFFARERPDVAAAFGRADWAASGWAAVVPTTALLAGNNVLSVYAHAPAKGWWYHQMTLNVTVGATPRPAPPALGFDISFPQCGGPEPTAPAFAVVGVNGGRSFSGNACLARQYVWALTATSPVQPRVAFYMNTGNPGPAASTRWPPIGTPVPQPCDGTWSMACAYDYGWLAAQDAYARARSVAGDGASLAPWWLDVEAANSWSTDVTNNAADLQGAIAFLRSVNVGTVGIYVLATDWESIIGAGSASAPQNAPFSPLPNWRPGAASETDAPTWCGRSVTGGRVVFVQYPAQGFDGNLACP